MQSQTNESTLSGKISRALVAAMLAAAVIAANGTRAVAQPAADDSGTAITIYSTATPGAVPPELYMPKVDLQQHYGGPIWQAVPGYGIVKQTREVELGDRRSTVRFTDVAAYIDPTTVSFTSLTDPDGTHVLEQNFEFDLVSTAKLMERYIDKTVTFWQVRGDTTQSITGKLLSTTGGIVLQDEDGSVQVINGYVNVHFPELPGGLITKPTLVWDVLTDNPGPQRVRTTYETKGMTWWADYNIAFEEGSDANSGVLDVNAWVSILNQTGAGYEDAKLKLVAGDVHRAQPPAAPMYSGIAGRQRGAYAEADMGFQEKAFFEYHLYTLGRPSTLPDRSTKQIELFPPVSDVPCEKVLVYYGLQEGYRGFFPKPLTDSNFGTQSNSKVDIYLRFKNEEEIGMGMPLPSGRIRVSKLDPADETLEFIGEDTIDHTPKNEEVLIKLGNAFDVVGERTQTSFKGDVNDHWMEESFEIKLRNHKEEPVKVIIKENLYRWVNWEVKKSSHEFEKVDSRTIHVPVTIEADGEVTVTYTVRYTW